MKQEIVVKKEPLTRTEQSFEREEHEELENINRTEIKIKEEKNKSSEEKKVGKDKKAKIKRQKGAGLERVSCEICAKEIFMRSIKEHIQTVHGNDGGNCGICNKFFKSSKYLKYHVNLVHVKKYVMEPDYMCQFCPKEFPKSKLRAHIRNYHSGEDLNCGLCGKNYKSKKHFIAHKQMAHSQTEVICEICSKTFSNKHYLRQHTRNIHESEEGSVHCEDCGKAFAHKSHLLHHQKAVHSTNTSKCDVCSKVYKNSYLLRKH